MAVCEGCGSQKCCMYRQQVEKKRRKLAELLTFFDQEYGPVELESKFITFSHDLVGLVYDSETRAWTSL